jgi:hypothetical protein
VRAIIALILLCPVALAGQAQARTGWPDLEAVLSVAAPRVSVAAAAADRQSYLREARAEILDWRRRLEAVGQRAGTKGADADQAAQRDLTEAWSATQAAAKKLALVGDADWRTAQAAYEGARTALAAAWDKVQPEKK